VKRDPRDTPAAVLLAKTLRETGASPESREFGEALAILEQSVALDGLNRDARLELARLLLDAGRAEDAVIQLRAVAGREPRNRAAAYMLLRALMRTKRSAELQSQIQHYRAILADKPAHTLVRHPLETSLDVRP
jgi:thioredoxin-like negative regulator of GroEL